MEPGKKIFSLSELQKRIAFWKTLSDKIVFTNGCFDILHAGHIQLLAGCKNFGDRLIVGLNSDSSVKKLKGKLRPINNEESRATLLSAIEFVDAVIIFGEETPEKLIHTIAPDVLVKGGDWKKEEIVGSNFILKKGGEVKTVSYLKGYSTTEIIEKSRK